MTQYFFLRTAIVTKVIGFVYHTQLWCQHDHSNPMIRLIDAAMLITLEPKWLRWCAQLHIYTNWSTAVLPSVFSRGKLIPPVGVCSRAKAQTFCAQFPANHSSSTLIVQKEKIKSYYALRMSVQTSYEICSRTQKKNVPELSLQQLRMQATHWQAKKASAGRHLSLPYRHIKLLVSPGDIEGSTR